jgi:hypothetical protein
MAGAIAAATATPQSFDCAAAHRAQDEVCCAFNINVLDQINLLRDQRDRLHALGSGADHGDAAIEEWGGGWERWGRFAENAVDAVASRQTHRGSAFALSDCTAIPNLSQPLRPEGRKGEDHDRPLMIAARAGP